MSDIDVNNEEELKKIFSTPLIADEVISPSERVPYSEPYPIDVDSFADDVYDKIDKINKKIVITSVGIVGALLMAAATGRMVLKLVQTQAVLIREFNGLTGALGYASTPEPTGMVQPEEEKSEEVEKDEPEKVDDTEVSKPIELGSANDSPKDIPPANNDDPFLR
jgi:hypothetical protein